MTSDQTSVPVTDVSIYQAIYGRRMAWKYKDQPVPREVLERMLDTAVWAPNHRLTEPWRFFVVEKGSETRKKTAELAHDYDLQRNNNPARAESKRQSVLDPPVVIYVYSVPGTNEDVTQENYASVCCAAHNISLAAVAEGLAVTWETGGAIKHSMLQETLGAEPDWKLTMMLSIGVPDQKPASKRQPVKEFTRWLD